MSVTDDSCNVLKNLNEYACPMGENMYHVKTVKQMQVRVGHAKHSSYCPFVVDFMLLLSLDKNECKPNPCRNSGRCVDLVAGYFCECAEGWKGRTCILSKLMKMICK